MNINKSKVSFNFSKAVDSYDDASIVQKICAKKSFDLIKQDFFAKKSATLLEIGAGTGVFSQNFVQNENCKIYLTDISFKMVEKLKEKFSYNKNVEFFQMDGENFSLENKFDFIVSSSVFQWFSSLEHAFLNIKTHLSEEGFFLFSMYVDGTFENLKSGYGFLGKEFLGPRFFTRGEVENALLLSGFEILSVFEESFEFEFSSSFDFFKSLKQTGTIGAKNKNLSYRDLKSLVAFLDSKYRPFKECYKALFVKAKRLG